MHSNSTNKTVFATKDFSLTNMKSDIFQLLSLDPQLYDVSMKLFVKYNAPKVASCAFTTNMDAVIFIDWQLRNAPQHVLTLFVDPAQSVPQLRTMRRTLKLQLRLPSSSGSNQSFFFRLPLMHNCDKVPSLIANGRPTPMLALETHEPKTQDAVNVVETQKLDNLART